MCLHGLQGVLDVLGALKWRPVMTYQNNSLAPWLARNSPYAMLAGAGLDNYPSLRQVWIGKDLVETLNTPQPTAPLINGRADVATDVIDVRLEVTPSTATNAASCGSVENGRVVCYAAPGETFSVNIVGKDTYNNKVCCHADVLVCENSVCRGLYLRKIRCSLVVSNSVVADSLRRVKTTREGKAPLLCTLRDYVTAVYRHRISK